MLDNPHLSTADEQVDVSKMAPTGRYARIEPAQLKDFSICQKIFVGLLGLVLLYLIGFIIYISCTWNKDRINEYS
jgi:hypothetical protein